MYTINGTKHDVTLEAIKPSDKRNIKHKKHLDFFEHELKIYYVFDGNQFDGPFFYRKIVNFFESLKKEINIDIDSFLNLSSCNYHQEIITCLLSASELFNNSVCFKTSKESINKNNFIIRGHENLVNFSQIIVDAETWSKKMIQMPSNLLTADDVENNIAKQFKEFGSKIKIKVLSTKDLQAKKMGLILSVGSGSNQTNQPRIIVIDYHNAKTDKIALIGKGIIFDTGGINLKPTSALKNMHGDMAGAVISAGTIYALAKTNAEVNVCAVIPLTSNDINERSLRVNDVVKSYSGKTIEITNTDAEGRLILADGITYAANDLKASTIVSIATLTGGIVVALGSVFAGYWSTNDQQAKQIKAAAIKGCEAIWRMPFHDEFLKALNSRIADHINAEHGREGTSIVAAEFLKIFSENKNFIHFDIAGSSELKTTFVPTMLRTLFYFLKG